jgi:protein TonB
MKSHPLKSRFAIPVAVALSAHAILLFGFTHPQVDPPAPSVPEVMRGCDFSPVAVNFAPKPDDGEEVSDAPSKRVDAAPSIEELAPIGDSNGFTQRLSPPMDGTKISPQIPMGVPRIGGWEGGVENSGPTISRIGDLDRTPRTRFQARPDYPFAMRSQGINGTVVVDFLVDEAGVVSDVRVMSATRSEFEESTCRAVAKWRFEPGTRNGRPVRFRMSVPVVFSLGS